MRTLVSTPRPLGYSQPYFFTRLANVDGLTPPAAQTFANAPLFGGEYAEPDAAATEPTVTVQFQLVFPGPLADGNAIVVRYGELASSLTAVIGPSNGTGVPPGFGQDMPPLPGGSAR